MEEGIFLFPRAYPLEMWQFLASLFGSAANLWGVFDAHRDVYFWKVAKGTKRQLRRAKMNLFEEYVRLSVLGMFIFNGLVSITHAPPNPGLGPHDERYYQLAVSRIVMALASVALASKSIRDIHYRRGERLLPSDDEAEILEVIKDKAVSIVTVIDETKKGKEGKTL